MQFNLCRVSSLFTCPSPSSSSTLGFPQRVQIFRVGFHTRDLFFPTGELNSCLYTHLALLRPVHLNLSPWGCNEFVSVLVPGTFPGSCPLPTFSPCHLGHKLPPARGLANSFPNFGSVLFQRVLGCPCVPAVLDLGFCCGWEDSKGGSHLSC